MEFDSLKSLVKTNGTTRSLNELLFAGNPVCFSHDRNLVWEIKQKISNQFVLPIRDIEIVGSAKLGISLSEERFGKKYYSGSDIDIIIVSSTMFTEAWNVLLSMDFDFFRLSDVKRDHLKESYGTIHRGYISPERLPACDFKQNWWKLFNELSNKKRYEHRKIRGRLFVSWKFAEKYYSIQFNKLSK